MIVPRVEGTLQLVQEPGGRLRAAGARPRGIERLLLGRSPLEAVYLSQQASAHSGVSHALAAVRAWEDAGKLPVAPNGVLLRELLHLLSFLHGHVQHFYFQTLPDYLPLSAWVPPLDENGPAARIASGIVASAAKIWEPPPFQSRFDEGARRRFAERTVEAVRTLSSLQRMMSVIGGKFPVVMSIAPGGMTMALDEAGALRLLEYLQHLEPFLTEAVLDDGLSLIDRYPETLTLGKGGANFISLGSTPADETGEAGLFPTSVLLGRRLQGLTLPITESIGRAYYRVPRGGGGHGPIVEEALGKPGAYSWIKAPRVGGSAVETGAIGRLVITQLAGIHGRASGMAALVQEQLGVPLEESNTVAGRIVARLGELDLIFRRCREILEKLAPGEPFLDNSADPSGLSGEGVGQIESPSGAVRHHMVVEDGRIGYYDIIAASTWNGSSQDENEVNGPLDTALGQRAWDLQDGDDRLDLSRIVHAFAFSATDAVH
ncbi:MAG: nickel-dependent hydrogenase large subunit [SAR324 cluster bacterium]|nr:nickel-dependent hydrogenase large subunit [SAR324 cluster bacterium]